MKATVFGGSGFLGSHLADALQKGGNKVVIFDRISSPYLQKEQEMIVGDILDREAVKMAVKDSDVVYNFAGIADLEKAKEDPVKTVETNILGNTIILDACREYNIKRFVFASSLYVYSKAGSFYRSSKQACELIIENYREDYGLPYTILRYGSLYGPRADENNFIYKILNQAIAQGKITRYGDGEELREYIHVEDAARFSVDILSKEFENEYVILTGHQQMKIRNLLTMIDEMLGNRLEIEYLPTKSNLHYNITQYSFSPKIAKKYIGKYYFDIGQGLLQCLEETYKKQHKYKEVSGLLMRDD
ncbi:MAG: NAD(P)-dependent oxidoreductase [Candidatus Methanoperedens sp.]